MSEIVVSKFGGTSVADFDAMNRSADIVLSDANVRLVVLSASAGITNLLVALAEGLEPGERFEKLDAIRNIQFAILERLRYPNVIREEIERLLENITVLAEAAALATSPALTDELVSHGELMSTLLFVEILRERDVQAQWFDVRKVMRTNDRFGRAEPDVAALAELAALQLLPRLNDGLVITQGFIGSENKGRTTTLGRGGSDYTAALLAEALHASRVDIWTDVPGIYTTDPRVVSAAKRIDEIAFAEAAEMATFGAKVLHPATLLPAVRSDIPVFVGSSKDPRAGGTLVCNKTENPPLFRALALRRNQTLLTLHSLNMLHSRGFLAEVFGILARHNISVDLITTSEVSVALTLDTTGSTSTGDTLLTQSLLMELSALCRVEVEEGLALVALIGNDLSKACGVGKEVFGVHLRPIKIDDTVDVDLLARQTPGFSGADIANVCNEAALIAARHGKKFVGKQDFLDAVDRIIGGLEKKTKITTEAERRSIALHEAGHASISWLLEYANPLIKVTIVPRGRALGAAWYLPEERQITTKEQMLDEMCATLGGRAAEDLFLGRISTGAMNDLERVTKQAYGMIAYLGMSEKLPNLCYYNNEEYSFNRPYSEKTAELIDEEVKKMVNEQYERAKRILSEHKEGHNELAQLLIDKEVIFAEDVERIFGKRPWASRSEEIMAAKESKDAADAEKALAQKVNEEEKNESKPATGESSAEVEPQN